MGVRNPGGGRRLGCQVNDSTVPPLRNSDYPLNEVSVSLILHRAYESPMTPHEDDRVAALLLAGRPEPDGDFTRRLEHRLLGAEPARAAPRAPGATSGRGGAGASPPRASAR
jgi:hypothetical protein